MTPATPQRFPVIFWLLLAATLAVDAVAVLWWAFSGPQQTAAVTFYTGLIVGQISVAAIWAWSTDSRQFWRWLLPFALIASAAGMTVVFDNQRFRPDLEMLLLHVTCFVMQVALILVSLWLFAPMLNRRTDGTRSTDQWRFQVKHLLVAMTAVSVLIVLTRRSVAIADGTTLSIWITNNVLVALSAVYILQKHWHWVLRLAALLGVALGLSIFYLRLARIGVKELPENLVQALVLFCWLQLGGIFPRAFQAGRAESPADSAPEKPA